MSRPAWKMYISNNGETVTIILYSKAIISIFSNVGLAGWTNFTIMDTQLKKQYTFMASRLI